MKSHNQVYIAATATIVPPLYSNNEVMELFYPKDKVPKKVHKMSIALAKRVGIQNRSMVLEPTILPEKKLLSLEHTPKNWGLTLLEKISYYIDLSEIGLFSVAYNATSHQDILPNLACQIAIDAKLNLDKMPIEIAYYGCAAGIFSISEAVNYCRIHQRAAFVYVFDQCTWIMNPIHEIDHPNFKACLRAYSIFSDAAIGILIIPETMRYQFPSALMKIIDFNKGFQLGDTIKMKESHVLVGKGVSETMPILTTKQSIKPLLEKHSLTPAQITEWSIHQGGIPVLEQFKESSILGLSDENIQQSKNLFQKYGNLSSPSSLYVLDSFFQEKPKDNNSYGLVTGFGAGYYFGSLLYQWE